MHENKIKDLLILGAGPAGIASAIYAARGLLDCTIIDGSILGGQLNWTQDIENYPGYPSIKGYELIQKFEEHLNKFNVETELIKEVTSVELTGSVKTISTTSKTYQGKALIICTGATPRKLGVKGEKEFAGSGVSYCAVCDGAFFKSKRVAVIGGGNSALEESLYLTRYASEVYVIHRRNEFRASKMYQQKVSDNPNIHVIWDNVVEEIQGSPTGVNQVILKNVKTSDLSELHVEGVFPFIGLDANTQLFKNDIALDDNGYIITKPDMSTNIPGVFAAGDVRNTVLRQIVAAASDGAIAGTSAIKYIDSLS